MTHAKTIKFQRRKVLIKHSLQFKWVGMVFLSVLAASLIVGTDINYSMARIIMLDNPSLAPQVTQLNTIIIVKVSLYLALMLLISLFVSHRFAGPIYRFEKSAQVVGSGNLTHRVSLRTGDELMELQEEFNGMLANLQSMVRKDREEAERLAARIEDVLKKITPDAMGAHSDLQSIKNDLKGLTRSFKV